MDFSISFGFRQKFVRSIMLGAALTMASSFIVPALAADLFQWGSPDQGRYEEIQGDSEAAVLRISSDAAEGYSDLKLVLDSEAHILALRLYSKSGNMSEFQLSQLQAGAVLLHQSGYDIAKIVSSNFSSNSGGSIDLVYLSNGIFNSYERFSMELVKNAEHWVLQVNESGRRREFSNMFMKGRTVFGKLVGIEKVEVN